LCRAEGRYREADATIERVVALAPVPEPAGSAAALIAAGESAAARGELALAVARCQQSARVAAGRGELTEAARAGLALRSMEALATGDLAQLDAEVAVARQGDPSLAADALIGSGWAHLHAGEPAVAVDRFSQCLDLAQVAGDQLGAARAVVCSWEPDARACRSTHIANLQKRAIVARVVGAGLWHPHS
jgi:tetratricopeptide (TPR) repeat protein